MNKIEQGFNPQILENTERQGIPTVTRRERLIVWNLLGNAPEQNEQLGIQNIQALFLEKFPEFNQLFPRGEDGKIAEDRRREAKKFILDKVKSQKDFVSYLEGIPIQIKAVPYFQGRYPIVLQKSFISWVINIDPTIDMTRKPYGYWIPETIGLKLI